MTGLSLTVDFNGLSLPLAFAEITGWDDQPSLDDGSVAKPMANGSWSGLLRSQDRVVQVSGQINETPSTVRAVVAAIAAAMVKTDDLLPLTVTIGSDSAMMLARCTGRVISGDIMHALGAPQVTLQFTGGPEKLSPGWSTATTLLPQPPSGIEWDITWDADWGEDDGSSGQVTCVNDGNAPAPARILFTGPVSMPSVTIDHTGDVLEFSFDLADGQALLVNSVSGAARLTTLAQAVNAFLIDPFDASLGADRSAWITARSIVPEDFYVPAGATDFYFLSPDSGTGSMRIAWRSASL